MIRRYRTTRRSRERVSELSPLSFDDFLSLDARLIYVDPNEEGPSFLGFGGALTRASQELLHEMDEGTRKEALSLLFGKEGLNYSLLRLTISSTDFGSSCYDYLGGGHDLSSFSFEEEKGETELEMIAERNGKRESFSFEKESYRGREYIFLRVGSGREVKSYLVVSDGNGGYTYEEVRR